MRVVLFEVNERPGLDLPPEKTENLGIAVYRVRTRNFNHGITGMAVLGFTEFNLSDLSPDNAFIEVLTAHISIPRNRFHLPLFHRLIP